MHFCTRKGLDEESIIGCCGYLGNTQTTLMSVVPFSESKGQILLTTSELLCFVYISWFIGSEMCVFYEKSYYIDNNDFYNLFLDSFNLICAKMFMCVLEDVKRDYWTCVRRVKVLCNSESTTKHSWHLWLCEGGNTWTSL